VKKLVLFYIFFLIVSYATAEEAIIIDKATTTTEISTDKKATKTETPLEVIGNIEKNLIYSKEVVKPLNSEEIIIKEGGWNSDYTREIEDITYNEGKKKKIDIKIEKKKDDKEILLSKKRAYDAINIKQYEVAAKIYKEVLKRNKNDMYAVLGLATAYQYLGQYAQAKPLYLKVLKKFPTDQQVMVNLLSIIIEETPYEAAYLASSIVDKNLNSAILQAQASIAYAKIKKYDEAINYIIKAINLDETNLKYRYNLAILYDLSERYDDAKNMYAYLINYSSQDTQISLDEIQARIDTINSIQHGK
jgi:Flp pilus assembly protein TadD